MFLLAVKVCQIDGSDYIPHFGKVVMKKEHSLPQEHFVFS